MDFCEHYQAQVHEVSFCDSLGGVHGLCRVLGKSLSGIYPLLRLTTRTGPVRGYTYRVITKYTYT